MTKQERTILVLLAIAKQPLILLVAVTASAIISLLLVGCAGDSTIDVTQSNPESGPDASAETGGDWYKPKVSVEWQWQLKGAVNTTYPVELYDVDLFDSSADLIQGVHASGKKVICYFSAGSDENWRPDHTRFQKTDTGNALDGWPDEKWLDVRSPNVRAIMQGRLDLAREKGCDGVEPDNMDGYQNETGFDLTGTEQLSFNRFIAAEAHDRNLSVGLKNDLDQIGELVDYYDFAVNEQCFEYSECEELRPFITNGKPVLNAEYSQEYINDPESRSQLCGESSRLGFSTLILPLALDDTFRFSCLSKP